MPLSIAYTDNLESPASRIERPLESINSIDAQVLRTVQRVGRSQCAFLKDRSRDGCIDLERPPHRTRLHFVLRTIDDPVVQAVTRRRGDRGDGKGAACVLTRFRSYFPVQASWFSTSWSSTS